MNLVAETFVNIRFGETDAMGVVWHGNYIKYFEDAREAFGAKHDLNYLDIYHQGYFTPIVKAELDYKSPLYYGEKAVVKIIFHPSRAAKLVFDYEILNLTTGLVSATGQTIQVFLNASTRELELNKPDFFSSWEKKKGLHI